MTATAKPNPFILKAQKAQKPNPFLEKAKKSSNGHGPERMAELRKLKEKKRTQEQKDRIAGLRADLKQLAKDYEKSMKLCAQLFAKVDKIKDTSSEKYHEAHKAWDREERRAANLQARFISTARTLKAHTK